MGTARVEKECIWARCWDGTEQEYESFSNKELQKWFEEDLSNYEIASTRMGAVLDDQLELVLQEKRSQLTEEEF